MKNKRASIQKTYLTILAILSILCLVSICLAIVFFTKYHAKATTAMSTNITEYTEEQVNEKINTAQNDVLANIKTQLSNGTGVSSLLRSLYPNNIVYYNTDRYVFADINSNLAKNNFVKENFQMSDSGEITYSQNSTITSHKGIDVSKFQGTIDWKQVKNSGIEFAIIRVGYRSYGTGLITDDTAFESNIKGANDNQISAGVYFFTQAITTDEAIEEADYVISRIKDYTIKCPVVLDVEEILNDTYRQQNLTSDELTNIAIAFCERIKAAGYTPMIYGNLKGFLGILDLTKLESYEKWFAYYDNEPYLPYAMSIWQYSESGTVAGIPNKVDLNISFKSWNQKFIKFEAQILYLQVSMPLLYR